jgi:hypothetical protein
MAHHPSPIVLHIVGTEADDRGRSCEEHHHCGEVLEEDMVLRLRKVQIKAGEAEETAIAAIWVTDGIDRCRVGFLQRHMVAHAARFDGALAQVTKVLSADDGDTAERRLFHKNKGCCYATIISHLPMPKVEVKVKEEKKRGEDNNNKQGGGNKRSAEYITLE